MKIQTSRFGELEVDDSRIITFPKGLLGFAKYTHFALIQRTLQNPDPTFNLVTDQI